MIHHDVMEPVVGNQGDEWKNAIVDLSEFNGKVIGIRLRGYTGGADKSDLALDDITITDVTSVNDLQLGNELTLYPNPTTGMVNLSLDLNADGQVNVEVFDISGRMVYSDSENVIGGKINKAIDLSGLDKGVYFVKVKTASAEFNQKLTIQ
jgi:hypothetical protein